jgi:EAL and modified HD-GYP domain-containing signal transduction protein
LRCFVARQPIFDRRLNVFAYELLFRSGFDNFCDCLYDPREADAASSDVLTTSFVLTGLEELTGGKRATVNLTRDLLIREIPTLFSPRMLMLEILETVVPDVMTVEACRRLKEMGYKLVIDDFVLDDLQNPLLELAEIVKVDFGRTSVEEREEIPQLLKGSNVKLLAEKVETVEQFDQAMEWKYAYFQGYFFSVPVIRYSEGVPGSKLVYLRILSEINKSEVDFQDIENIIKQDVSLSYKLLRFINSAYFGLHQPVQSIGHALTLLGMKELKKWVSLTALSRLADDKPDELVVTSLIRARECELLATELGLADIGSELFLMGMFSLIDAIINRPMSEILGQLPLSEETKAALLGGSNLFRDILVTIVSYERGDWSRFSEYAQRVHLREGVVAGIYHESVKWVDQIFGAVSRKEGITSQT